MVVFDVKKIAVNLRVARAKVGITQLELAKRSGVCETTICFIEQGKVNDIRTSTLHKLAYALGIEIEDLIN